ncbi:MAG: hypothetical protein ABH986_03800 [archaeon]
MQEKELAESIAKAIDFNLSQIFNEIDLKVKEITHIKAESIHLLKPKKQETRVLVFSEIKAENNKLKAVISFSKENAFKMADLIKGASFGSTKLLSSQEIIPLKDVSTNLFKASINSLNSITTTTLSLTEPEIVFSFSDFENEFIAGNLSGEGRFFEFSLVVGGTDIKGEMKFFIPMELMKQ